MSVTSETTQTLCLEKSAARNLGSTFSFLFQGAAGESRNSRSFRQPPGAIQIGPNTMASESGTGGQLELEESIDRGLRVQNLVPWESPPSRFHRFWCAPQSVPLIPPPPFPTLRSVTVSIPGPCFRFSCCYDRGSIVMWNRILAGVTGNYSHC